MTHLHISPRLSINITMEIFDSGDYVIVHDGNGNGDVLHADFLPEEWPVTHMTYFIMSDYVSTLRFVKGVLWNMNDDLRKEIEHFVYVHTERSWLVSLEEEHVANVE
jgi:hypothetical protein